MAYELSNTTLEGISLALKFEYIGIAPLPLFWFLLAVQYTGHGHRLLRWHYAALLAIPIITLVLHYTNSYHHLFYRDLSVNTEGFFPMAKITKGIWYYINLCYTNLLIVSGCLFFLRMIFRTTGSFKKQAIVIFITSLIPWVGQLIYQAGLSPYNIDLIPIALTITGPSFALTMFGYQMFGLTPIARDVVFFKMKDPVIVLDHYSRIADFNNSAQNIFHCLNEDAIGVFFNKVFQDNIELMSQVDARDRVKKNITIEHMGNICHFNIQLTMISTGRGNDIGKLITFHDVTEETRLLAQMHKLATTDELTSINNRRYFLEICHSELSRTMRNGRPVSILMIDVDWFKRVNDRHGHLVGDRVLKKAAETLQDNLRACDVLGRYGGEEFCVLLPETAPTGAGMVAERLRKAVEGTTISINDLHLRITISIGLCGVVSTTDQTDLETLLKQADKALYQAKGCVDRNRVETLSLPTLSRGLPKKENQVETQD